MLEFNIIFFVVSVYDFDVASRKLTDLKSDEPINVRNKMIYN